jgi:dTDP-4-dehydrorhamnose reductase
MKKVLIFGKDGQLGYDLTRVFGEDYNQVALNREAVDVTNASAVKTIIEKEKPDFIINATAYNKVEAAEQEKETAFAINKHAVGNMAKAAKEAGAVFVHVSTDYVFDGSLDFFTEDDVPNPLNTYGQSKLAGEELVKSTSTKYYLIRTSSVFGAKEGKQKKNFVETMVLKAKAGQPIKVVDDQIMSPTYSYDLAKKIKELIEKPAPFGIDHITNQGSCSWYEFMNIQAEVKAISTTESGTKVNRPKKSILKNLALEKIGLTPMPPWQDALDRYLKEKY